MTRTRRTITAEIERHPGIHFSELVRRLNLAPGQVQYHLRRLRRTDTIVEEQLYGKTHYYPPDVDPWEQRACALLRRETAGDVVAYLLTNGPTKPATIATDLEIARSTLSWQTDRLVEQDLVGKRDGPDGVRLSLQRPVETARLLREIDPSLWEQLVGRFTRLVDRLLE